MVRGRSHACVPIPYLTTVRWVSDGASGRDHGVGATRSTHWSRCTQRSRILESKEGKASAASGAWTRGSEEACTYVGMYLSCHYCVCIDRSID
jgi:hypothetical protein